MILTIDVGNTNIVLGVMKGLELVASFRLTTQLARTSDEYGVTMTSMLSRMGIKTEDIEGAIIASVVPDVMYSLRRAVKRYFGHRALVVGPGLKTGMPIRVDNPKEMGADRIVNCVAAQNLYGGPCMAIDFGTATTYDLVNEKGEIIGCIISPGIKVCADALVSRTAKLPQVEIKKPQNILDAKNTVTSIQAGLVYGYIGQVEYIVKQVKEEMGIPDLKVIATGGLGRIIVEDTDVIDEYDPLLTLKGLSIIYEKNK